MNDYDFKSSICTSIGQSERLLALGLKKETADMYYPPFYFENSLIDYFDAKVLGGSVREEMMAGYEEYKDYIPAWSLHRLMELMPYSVEVHNMTWTLQLSKGYVRYGMVGTGKAYVGFIQRPNTYDAIIDCIEWLIKDGHFETEYLETIHNA